MKGKIIMNPVTNFTRDQACQADQAILRLMKKRRFFLANEHGLAPGDFYECIDFYQDLKRLYKDQADLAKLTIENKEKLLGVSSPVLKDGQSIVTCSLYTGGLEICDVYLLQPFLSFLPKSYDELYAEMFTMHHGEIDDIPPRQLSEKKKEVKILTDRLWAELQVIASKQDGIVLMMGTKFDPTYQYGFSVLKSKVDGLVSSPEGLAYLFYKHECINRLVESDYILFNGDRDNHTRIAHWSDEAPKITFENSGGYDCKTKFVCLL